MKAVVIEEVGRVVVREIDDPVPRGQALVRIETAGVCGTDLKILSGAIPVRFPLVLGHEMVGRVATPGSMGLFPEGARVLVNPSDECGHCWMCRADRGQLCPNGALRGRDADGGFAEFMAIGENRLHLVPESMTQDEAALLQVLATCVHAQSLVSIFPGQSAVVVGLGVGGFLHLQLLRARGIRDIVGVTRSPWKRDLALRLGANVVVTPEEAVQAVAEFTGGHGADLVVECVGQPSTLRQSVELAGLGGTVLVFGTVAGSTDMPTYQWYFKELTIVNSRAARARDYDRAVQLATEGVLDLGPLVTGRFPLAEAASAFEACASSEQLKVMLQVS